ncbi:scavenger receptor cysteine-rich type 1 protein M130-like [Trichomycterus rosablanca]|uniref:scavenger receptor cysteine-rich type 1 protein M130-like n=1 Tax=Trichomycterus rosablanca TaxID=2290929 RepID=UPI002F352937
MELLLMVIALHALCLFQGEFYMLSLSQVCSGTLGAFYNGSWVPVSLQSLSILEKDDIGHICNSLGCGGVFDFRENNTAPFNTCLTDCVFINSTLHNCSTAALDNCLKLMEIFCEWQAVRLKGGKDKCEGRVELLNAGLWGSVCDDEWDSNGGNVVCAQLDCGTAVHITHKASWFGQGTGPVYISKLNCTGNEKNLWECSTYNHRDNNYCGHKEDAGVVCSESLEKTVESSSMLSSAVLGCIVLSIVLVFALFLIAAQSIYYRKRNALDDDPVVAECNQEQEKASGEDNAVKNKPHYAESDSESTSSGECYENTQAEEEELLNPDAVSDSESTFSGECYENTQVEEEELLNPGHNKLTHIISISLDDSSTSSEEAYENVPPCESSDDSDYDDIANW